jgi:hypothetical protein
LLLSYAWLVRHSSDLKIAKECGLLPDNVTPDGWHAFVGSLSEHINFYALDQVNVRYIYGQFRLNRLNHVYRFSPRFSGQQLVFAYGLYPSTYGQFIRQNLGCSFVLFAYVSIMLAALRVELGME